jgi:glycosyltransferase involved in cell wall biosynthesis
MKVIVAHSADPTSPRLGGGIRWATNVATSLSDRGHEVSFVGFQSTRGNIADSERVPFRVVSLYKGPGNWRVYLLNLFVKLPFLDLPSDAVVAAHRLDILLAFVLFMPRNPKILVSTGRLYAAQRLWPTWFPLIRWLYGIAERYVFARIDLLAIMDEKMQRQYVGMGDQVEEKLRWTWTAVDTDKFKPLDVGDVEGDCFGIDSSKTTIAFAGRLDIVKNLDFLLRAYRLVEADNPSVQLVLFGEGPERQSLMHLAGQIGLERVVFAGAIPPAEMPLVLNCADVVVLPAVGGEGSPTILKEALACGVPVVSMDVGDVRGFIDHPLAGKVINVLDERTFAQAIAEVIALRGHSKTQMTEACRSIALKYSVEALGAHWEELCAEAIARRAHE